MVATENHPSLLEQAPIVISLGVSAFAEALTVQGVPVVQVDWRPPAGGDEDLMRLLDGLL